MVVGDVGFCLWLVLLSAEDDFLFAMIAIGADVDDDDTFFFFFILAFEVEEVGLEGNSLLWVVVPEDEEVDAGLLYALLDGSFLLDDDALLLLGVWGAALLNFLLLDAEEEEDDVREP